MDLNRCIIFNVSLEGFREHRHTADWELEAWAPEITGLFIHAAYGMNKLINLKLLPDKPVICFLDVVADDYEGLLVKFLGELIYLLESRKQGFTLFELKVENFHLSGKLQGAFISSIDKEIKAVTWHKLRVSQNSKGYRVNIVFDV